jgi:hypothetical protein
MRTTIHNANITELSKTPAHAHLLDLSVNKPKMPTTNDSGGTNNTRTLPKSPDRSPHPKPGKHNNAGITKNQGDKAKQTLILPNLFAYFI